MISRLQCLGAVLLWVAAASRAAVPVQQVDVIASYPHDPRAFTQGLLFTEGVLYEGTGRNGESTLRKVELATGNVLQSTALPAQHFGEGITLFQDKLYQLTWQSHLGFVYEKDTLKPLRSFYLPGEGWGITHDGSRLIISDGSANLRFFDPATLKEVSRIVVTEDGKPLDRLNELEFVDGEVWANVWYTDTIVRIDPTSGQVVGKLDLHGLNEQRGVDDVLNGIAWDAEGKRLFVTGKLWSRLYEVKPK